MTRTWWILLWTSRDVTARRDLPVALALAGATALSRLPFVTTRLWQWDSVLYARAIENGFHVTSSVVDQRPHPPGYVFYVATASLLHYMGLGTNEALVAVSVIASAIACGLMYLLCVRLAPRPASVLVAAAFSASPLVWLHGEVAHIYAVLACVSTTLAFAFLAAWGSKDLRSRIVLSALLGLLAGFRQDLLVYFAPLWLYSLVPLGWRQRAAALAVLAAACLTWFIPSALLSGGPVEYMGSVLRQTAAVSDTSANGARSLATNIALLALSLGWGLLGSGLLLAALLGARIMAGRRSRETRALGATSASNLNTFFALLLVPPVLFYLLVHIGEWGFALSIVPGLYASLALVVGREWSRARPRGRAILGGALTVVSAWGALLFVTGDDPVFSARALADHDRATAAKTEYIRQHLLPDGTLVLAGAELLVVRYYLPEYRTAFSNAGSDLRYRLEITRDVSLVMYEPSAQPLDPAIPAGAQHAAGLTIASMQAGTSLALGGTDIDVRR